MKIVKKNQLKIVIFTAVKYRCILHGNVCVLRSIEAKFNLVYQKLNKKQYSNSSDVILLSIKMVKVRLRFLCRFEKRCKKFM